MALIQICKSLCNQTSIYMITKIDLRIRVDLEIKIGPYSGSGESSLEELRIMESNILIGFFFFVMVLLSYAITPLFCTTILLKIKSSFDSLRVAKSCRRFFEQVAILE